MEVQTAEHPVENPLHLFLELRDLSVRFFSEDSVAWRELLEAKTGSDVLVCQDLEKLPAQQEYPCAGGKKQSEPPPLCLVMHCVNTVDRR